MLADYYDIYVKKEVKTETSITKTGYESYYLIQRDIDGDGNMDKEFTQSIIFSSVSATVNTADKATIYFQPTFWAKLVGWKGREEHISQYSVSKRACRNL